MDPQASSSPIDHHIDVVAIDDDSNIIKQECNTDAEHSDRRGKKSKRR